MQPKPTDFCPAFDYQFYIVKFRIESVLISEMFLTEKHLIGFLFGSGIPLFPSDRIRFIDLWFNKIFRSFCYGPDKMIAKLGETIEPSSRNKQHEYERKLKEKLEKLVASCQVPPWSNNQTNSGLESRYQHMVAVGKLHHNSIYCMSDIISQFKMLETSTKNILVKGSSLELMIIRAAFLKVCIFMNYS